MTGEWQGQLRRRAFFAKEALQRRFVRPKPSFDFKEMSTAYLNRISDPRFTWPVTQRQEKKNTLIVVTPWLFTAVPYFSMELGRALAAEGAQVRYLWEPTDILFNAGKPRETIRIKEVLDRLGEDAEVVELSSQAREVSDEYLPALQELVYENAVRQAGGESDAEKHLGDQEQKVSALRKHLVQILSVFEKNRPDLLIIPGGVFGVSGLYVLACRIAGIPFTTFDSGADRLIFTHDTVAAHMEDLAVAFKQIYPLLDSKKTEKFQTHATDRIAVRRAGKDVFRLQPSSSESSKGEQYDIFIPLNFRTDTAALLRQKLFHNVREWLAALLKWVASQPKVSIVIRQHPCERIPEYRGKDDWEEFLAPFRKTLGSRLRFVSAWDHINTYDLLAKAKVVLPYTSRVGVEAAFLGVPVILGTRCYYENLGFSTSPETRTEYFSTVRQALDGQLPVEDEARRRAAFLYYLAEECCLCPTVFNPTPEDFMHWVKLEPSKLMSDAKIPLLLDCLLNREVMPKLLFQESNSVA
ncbi:MAG: hypothetical protein ABI443_09040 [Chthoniobacterales bacterium]